ncbi:unnamed protein product [Mytilus coruscus]|uniref:Uncharacterized protein n=1 Tax=Mytilus coruscus TaxID=42192 RepID=A0A6J8BAX4_MYTCO|nr:unnamed protein product [Mytilus coruscus]
MKNRNHSYLYLSKILREHEQSDIWTQDVPFITGMKFMAPEIVAILQADKLRTYNLSGGMINSLPISRSVDSNSQIACLNDSTIAVTIPSDNLIEIVTVMALTTKTDLGTPAGTIMTGGITCRMDILCVAFTDAIRLMDLSGQIQRVINIPSVKILHSVNNDKLLCVYSKCDSDKTMSCLDITNDSLHDFERFPFHPKDVTIDDVGNIIFIEDGVIWQSDSDGKNFKIIMTPNYCHWYKHLTYNKRSKTLLTVNWIDNVEVYKKLE